MDIHVIGFAAISSLFHSRTKDYTRWDFYCFHRIGGEVSSSRTRLKNVTNVLGQLLDDYDIRLRPDFGGR